ncbi:formiminoglutamase [Virgibacillus halotolerans]|nr:formiminoglutamase [Virgibacillus halotolerans]
MKNERVFSLIGFESDEGVKRNNGRIGAASAPNEVRKQLAKIPYNLDRDTRIIDIGNVACEHDKLEKAQQELGEQVAKLLHHSCTPIIIGGGHETLYGHYLGVRKFIGSGASLGIINIDAHFDMRESEISSSGTMFKQILDEDQQAGYLCLGIQQFGNTKALFNIAETYGCQYIMEESLTFEYATKKVIDEFADKYDYVLLTLCTDSINSSAAPGVSAPSPFGLDPKLVRSLLGYIVAKENVTSFDISEVNPLLDEDDKTTRLAAYLIAEVMKSFRRI